MDFTVAFDPTTGIIISDALKVELTPNFEKA